MILNNILNYFLFNSIFLISWTIAFQVYWNVPTQYCKRKYGIDFVPVLQQYGILVNNDDRFQGDKITIFYESQLGLYPSISKDQTFQHGGIPQLGNLEAHLEKATKDINRIIPQNNFAGLGVLDWEAWRPIWNFLFSNFKKYRDAQERATKNAHPNLPKTALTKTTENEWEQNAKTWMLRTLELAKQMRPDARWCYYLFPDCYNHKGTSPETFQCKESVRIGNNKLSWLWQASTAICPSIYLKSNDLNEYSFEQRMWKDQGKLKEAMRVASPEAKIFPYVTYYLDPAVKTMVPEEDMKRSMAQIAAVGADGAVIWGSSASVGSQDHCEILKDYISTILGPLIEKVARKHALCKKDICNNHGTCTWPKDNTVNAWKLFIEDGKNFDAADITCRCYVNYRGRFCENS